jgi:hypothetical protein
MSFEYNGWIVSDEYACNKKYGTLSEYRIKVSSNDIFNENELECAAFQGRELTDTITKLLPYVAFVSLNEPQCVNSIRTETSIIVNSPTKGWTNNYNEVESDLTAKENIPFKVICSYDGTIHYAKMTNSPLNELKTMLEAYDGLSNNYKFLIFLHNAIKESEDINRYMLIGKALEIVNTIYPYERHRGKDDDRIERFHPELAPIFGKITLKDLMEWSNNRQETRHYMRNLKDSHPRLTEEEREKLYLCSVSLITNIIRNVCGLEVQTFIRE